jgi:FkbM family methyltransferase
MREVLGNEQYACLRGLTDVRTIVDAGANVGAAAVFLLNAYPHARLIALEPDAGNFEMLERNLSAYGPRAVSLRKALWCRQEPLAVRRGHFRDGGEWTFQVAPTQPAEESDVEGLTLAQLLGEYGIASIDILKMDIEGAERLVFGSPDGFPLDRVKTIAVELHDEECRQVFLNSVRGVSASLTRHGEVTLWCRERVS